MLPSFTEDDGLQVATEKAHAIHWTASLAFSLIMGLSDGPIKVGAASIYNITILSLSRLLPLLLPPFLHCFPSRTRSLDSMVKDQWMTSAMADDDLVVQLLLRLKQSQASPSDLVIPLSWGLRQPRSRSFPSFRCAAVSNLDSTRCSPSTPLSWTGLHSSSPTSDASDDSTHPPNFSPRSKDTSANASAAGTYPTVKSSRKRKSLEELKREGLFSDDRVHLGKESVVLCGTFKEHTANNESFKRMKLNLNLQSPCDFTCVSAEQQKESSERNEGVGPCSVSESLLMHAAGDGDDDRRSDVYEDSGDFLLPDLNVMPCDMEKYDCL